MAGTKKEKGQNSSTKEIYPARHPFKRATHTQFNGTSHNGSGASAVSWRQSLGLTPRHTAPSRLPQKPAMHFSFTILSARFVKPLKHSDIGHSLLLRDCSQSLLSLSHFLLCFQSQHFILSPGSSVSRLLIRIRLKSLHDRFFPKKRKEPLNFCSHHTQPTPLLGPGCSSQKKPPYCHPKRRNGFKKRYLTNNIYLKQQMHILRLLKIYD